MNHINIILPTILHSSAIPTIQSRNHTNMASHQTSTVITMRKIFYLNKNLSTLHKNSTVSNSKLFVVLFCYLIELISANLGCINMKLSKETEKSRRCIDWGQVRVKVIKLNSPIYFIYFLLNKTQRQKDREKKTQHLVLKLLISFNCKL